MTRNSALSICDQVILALESSVQDYLGRQEPLLAECMEDANRAIQSLRSVIWQKTSENV